jgi:membrane-associated phospholipid phosphatase
MGSCAHPFSRFALERAAIALSLGVLFVAGYFGVGLAADPKESHDFATPIDGKIPFVAYSVWLYLGLFPAALAPIFFVRSPQLFRRAALAYAFAIVVSLILFLAYPVTSAGLRTACSTDANSNASCWAVSVLYSFDPPHNLFPSLHISIAVLAAYATWTTLQRWGFLLGLGVAIECVAVCTVKQHFVLDVLGGLVVGVLAAGLFLGPFRLLRYAGSVYSWRGPVTYLVCVSLFYTGLYAAYLYARH